MEFAPEAEVDDLEDTAEPVGNEANPPTKTDPGWEEPQPRSAEGGEKDTGRKDSCVDDYLGDTCRKRIIREDCDEGESISEELESDKEVAIVTEEDINVLPRDKQYVLKVCVQNALQNSTNIVNKTEYIMPP